MKKNKNKEKEENILKSQETFEKKMAEDLKLIRSKNIPKPNHTYSIGDELLSRMGNHELDEFIVVKEVLDEGKILLCEVHYLRSISLAYFPHTEVYLKNTPLKETISFRDEKRISFHNQHLSSLLHMDKNDSVNYNPIYQRGLCWNHEDKISLIDSIFKNIEIGKFAFIQNPISSEEKYAYEIMDGKQRLSTLVEFFHDGFKYQDRLFSELSSRDKEHFLFYSVTVGESSDSWDLESRMKYFLKMNVAGVPQSKEHLSFVESEIKKLKQGKT